MNAELPSSVDQSGGFVESCRRSAFIVLRLPQSRSHALRANALKATLGVAR